MGIFGNRMNRPGPGIPKDAPSKKGLALFWDILFREFFELVKLNLLFCAFCVPVITIPAACTAMSKITVTMVRDRNHFLWADFWAEFKADFKKSTGAGALVFLGIGAGVFGAWFYSKMLTASPFFYLPLALSCLIVLVLTVMGFYVFPMIALVDLPLQKIIRNAFLLTFVCLHYNLLALVITAGLTLFAAALLPVTLLLFPFLWFALMNFITTFCAYYGIRKYVISEKES